VGLGEPQYVKAYQKTEGKKKKKGKIFLISFKKGAKSQKKNARRSSFPRGGGKTPATKTVWNGQKTTLGKAWKLGTVNTNLG